MTAPTILESQESQEPPISAPAPDGRPAAYRIAGRELGSGEFTTSLVHFYRGELARSNTWRTRLDATTNWAVITTGAALTFAFSAAENTPIVILITTLLALLFNFIEARRYRYYELWTYRVRLMEKNYFAGLLAPGERRDPDWEARLTDSLRRPGFPITLLEAFGRRYRRNYAPLFLILALSWAVKVSIHPTPVASWAEFLGRASIGAIPGWVALAVGVVFNVALIALGLFTVGLRDSAGEVFGRTPRGALRLLARFRAATREALEIDLAHFKPSWFKAPKQLAYVVSDRAAEISKPLLAELDRGVTLLKGVGMYSGKEHGVLMCVVENGQIARLREIVRRADPHAFVIVTAAHDVRGEGFRPLET